MITIGTVGRDVPLEVLDAAGVRCVRLRGDRNAALADADRYLGVGVDPAFRSLLAVQLASGFAGLDAIVVSSDTDASQRLFYLLRELRKVEPSVPVPPVHLVDVLHRPRASSREYTLRKVRELATVVEEWTGTGITPERLTAASRERDAVRRAQRRLVELRRIGGLSGSELQSVLFAGDAIPPVEYLDVLERVERVPRSGVRVLLTGSGHDDVGVIAAIEEAGVVVVADDHPDGELSIGPLVSELDIADPVAAIAARWHANGPTSHRASIAERAAHTARLARDARVERVIAYVRERDDAPLWDAAAQGRATGLPVSLITNQGYGTIDRSALAAAVEGMGN